MTATAPPGAPLEGLRVLELASGVAGPYAGRLLALLGATVVKVEPPGGDPARTQPLDDRPLHGTSPLYLSLSAGKRNVGASARHVRALLAWADVVLDSRVRAELEGTEPDPRALLEGRGHPRALVSVTPFGFDAPRGGEIDDELLVQAASGVVLADPESATPRRFPGWQAQVHAGAYAAAGALAALAKGGAHHVDVAWLSCLLAGVEGAVSTVLHARAAVPAPPPSGARRDSQAGIQAGAFPAGVFACADGHVIPGSVRPIDWTLQCGVYGRPDLRGDPRFDRRHRFQNREELRAILAPWYAARSKRELFGAALDVGWAFAMVMTATDAISDEHLRAREFLGTATDGARTFLLPARPWRAPGLPARAAHVAALGEDDAGLARAEDVPRAALPRLEGVRVLELTRAWAGPFVGRFLGALGADVEKLEAARSPDGWRARLRWRNAGVEIPPGQDPEAYTWDAAALYNGLNRNKRQISVDLTRPGARLLFLGLSAGADLLVVNMTARVLAEFGLGYDVLARVNPRLVVVNMPALGASGPARAMPGYGMLIEGMGGFAARYGARDEAARATATYYPDAVAGVHATVAALAALAARERTGRGCEVDLSQQETLWLQLAEGIALASLEGREPDRLGDAEPGCSPSGIYPCADGWLALVVRTDADLARLVALARPALSALADLPREQRLAERDRVDAIVSGWTSHAKVAALEDDLRRAGVRARAVFDLRAAPLAPDVARLEPFEELSHPVTGRRGYLRIPLRIDGKALASRRAAPRFDEHTDEVLAEWAHANPADLAWLRRERVIGGLPGAGGGSV